MDGLTGTPRISRFQSVQDRRLIVFAGNDPESWSTIARVARGCGHDMLFLLQHFSAALAICQGLHPVPDAVFFSVESGMDPRCPDLTAFKFVQQVRELPHGKLIRLVAWSAVDDLETFDALSEDLADAGCDLCLRKIAYGYDTPTALQDALRF